MLGTQRSVGQSESSISYTVTFLPTVNSHRNLTNYLDLRGVN